MKRNMIMVLDYFYLASAAFLAIWMIFEPFWPELSPMVPAILGLVLLAAAIITPRRKMQPPQD